MRLWWVVSLVFVIVMVASCSNASTTTPAREESAVATPSHDAAPPAATPPNAADTVPAVESPALVAAVAPAAIVEPAPTPPPSAFEPPPAPKSTLVWNYETFVKLNEATGRNMKLSESAFDAVQRRKQLALKTISRYLEDRFDTADAAVLMAFEVVPREFFHYNYESNVSTASGAYESESKPWGIGFGSAISDYHFQAYMTQLGEPKPEHVALEIGTGSGFQSALLSRIVKEVYTIEIIEPLGNAVAGVLKTLGYDNVHQRVGDGYYGWPEVEGGFDIILVTCAALYVPPPLIDQLKPGGKLIIPVGPAIRGKQILYVYSKDAEGKVHSRRDVGVYFVPMTGAISEQKKPAA